METLFEVNPLNTISYRILDKIWTTKSTVISVFYSEGKWNTVIPGGIDAFKSKWVIADTDIIIGDYFKSHICIYTGFKTLEEFYETLNKTKRYIFLLGPPSETSLSTIYYFILFSIDHTFSSVFTEVNLGNVIFRRFPRTPDGLDGIRISVVYDDNRDKWYTDLNLAKCKYQVTDTETIGKRFQKQLKHYTNCNTLKEFYKILDKSQVRYIFSLSHPPEERIRFTEKELYFIGTETYTSFTSNINLCDIPKPKRLVSSPFKEDTPFSY